MYEAWAIRFRHIEDSVPLDKFWINIGMVCLNETPYVNLTTMNILTVHIVHQMMSALAHVRGLAIRHRDLDACNILIQIASSTIKVYLIDFARADLPDTHDTNHTESPNLILDAGNRVSKTERLQIRHAYQVPSNINPNEYILAAKEPSEFKAMQLVLEECVCESENLKLLSRNHKPEYEKNRTKLLLFLNMLFLTETDQHINDSIESTKALDAWDSNYVHDEIAYCYQFYNVFKGLNISQQFKGKTHMLQDTTKATNNIVEIYWKSLECTLPEITTLFDGLISEFDIVPETAEPHEKFLTKIIRICKIRMKQLKDTTKMSQAGINKSLSKYFEVQKKATWASVMDSLYLYKRKLQGHFKMITWLEQLHHSLAVITNLSMSIPPARASNFGIRFLNANLDCSDLHLKCIGSDEGGGSVLQVMKKQKILYAMKVYLKDTGTPIENMISRDQAYGEFKALTLTSTHPNFLRLRSNEVSSAGRKPQLRSLQRMGHSL